MFIEINNVHFYYESTNNLKPSASTFVFLHGFSGSSKDWKNIVNILPARTQVVTIDLIGHGKSDSPKDISPYSPDEITTQINSVITKLELEKVVLVGYSMGGRAALTLTKKYPQNISGLILESTSPGVAGQDERLKRKKSDEKLSGLIERKGIKNFVEYWMNLPLFQSQQKLQNEILAKIKSEKLKNNPTGLSNSLRGFGQGLMPHLWNDIQNIKNKVLLITGKLDEKYTQINSIMKSKMISAEHKIVPRAGHNIHLERPEVFVSLLKDFIKM
jgi:2-succinyl-6-hydroxy-2,4-cyclohexadiene-1-carboxylate synthase